MVDGVGVLVMLKMLMMDRQLTWILVDSDFLSWSFTNSESTNIYQQ